MSYRETPTSPVSHYQYHIQIFTVLKILRMRLKPRLLKVLDAQNSQRSMQSPQGHHNNYFASQTSWEVSLQISHHHILHLNSQLPPNPSCRTSWEHVCQISLVLAYQTSLVLFSLFLFLLLLH